MKTLLETDSEFICDIQAPCFKMLTREESELVKASKTQVLFRKGDNLTKQGAFASYVLFVITGLCKQYIEGEPAKNFNLRLIKPGEFVGLSAVFGKNTFGYSCVALTDCQVFLVEKAAISELIMKNGQFGFHIIKRYCEQNGNLTEVLKTNLYKQMNGRMADTLLYIDTFREEYPAVFQLLSRKELADFAGISTENAVKVLKLYEKEGIIQLQDKNIIILNTQKLLEISKTG